MTLLRSIHLVALVGALATGPACGDDPVILDIYVTAEYRDVVERSIAYIPSDHLRVREHADPRAALGGHSGPALAITGAELGCAECYRVDRSGDGLAVAGADLLGVQYGLADALERLGFRFFSPYATRVPEELRVVDERGLGEVQAPEMSIRGLHLHTLHPIEPYYAFWEPSPQNLDEARRTIDWIVKSRGNYVQWVALDDIQRSAELGAAWTAHTAAILDEARARGVRTGLGIQLFGSGNLQQAFDLLEGDEPDVRGALEARLPQVLDLPFDHVSLSFGEFFGEEPAVFVDTLGLTAQVIAEQRPDVTITGTIHVGDSPEQRIEYQGEDIIYYFLVKFVPEIVPMVHTVMFYNLFEDAGGAYHHDDFAEHRDYLLERLDAGERAIYHPETAYWVAFDNSVPVYLPIYVRSRWLDIAELRAAADPAGTGKLDEHIIFSTGWEWGYWQNDYASLRASFRLPDTWERHFHDMFDVYGERGTALADALVDLTELQREYLVDKRLMAYLAGRDVYIDLGDEINVVSQPDRPQFEEIVAMTADERQAFAAAVVDELAAFAGGTAAVLERVRALDFGADPFHRELVDAVEATLTRIRFAHAIFGSVVAHTSGQDAAGGLAAAQSLMEEGQAVVTRRHAALAYPRPELLTGPTTNATLYQFGYLEKADTLCYWKRELIQARRLISAVTTPVPPCVF